jgi:hypothetical protein
MFEASLWPPMMPLADPATTVSHQRRTEARAPHTINQHSRDTNCGNNSKKTKEIVQLLTPHETPHLLGPSPFHEDPEDHGENRKQQKDNPSNEARGNIDVRVRHMY